MCVCVYIELHHWSYKKHELFTPHVYLALLAVFGGGPCFWWGSLLLIFTIFCVILCVSFMLVCHCPVFCAPNVASVSGLFILRFPLGFILRLLDR